MNRKLIIVFALVFCFVFSFAQERNDIMQQSAAYEWPKDQLVKDKLDQWQDKKFGMIIHWGLYAIPGIIESWSICSEDWIERDSTVSYENYKKWYWDFSKQFNPTKFNPEQWSAAGKNAGMKYLVFTTKHHDGFAMFDTKQSDFSIAKGPFANNPRADVAKYVFDAFRKDGFMIGTYFSKPDWHSQYYWWQKYATADRNNNYDIRKYPWRWNKFKDFTYNQISELMNNYGSVDILWLDGGWVRPLETVNEEVLSWGANIPKWSQDIDMPKIAAMARKAQPGLLMVDRTVHGPYENYQTPEQRIPEKQLDYPWESCMTLGGAWGFVPNDQYKSSTEVVHKLVEIVAKGGSLLLGVGPKPDGTLPEQVTHQLNEIGKWTSKNGKAIYGTRITKHYNDGQTWFTQSKDAKKIFAIYCLKPNESVPANLKWKGNAPKKGSDIRLLSTGKKIKWQNVNGEIIVSLPKIEQTAALAFEFTAP
ncbi:alpha-L-fucosidase [Pedobacter agri]|uniref:alpha-L-fucosidase n=1 Tax=Pedobacter agri TaxID=454586 RepID=UPI0010F28187|nr:alpha-L-fucosidase [Pedobacter agri]MDQ1141783.1 alpha-L-fucosidase [Pedobacter agri]RYF25098.1 MAG: alpha-L-fucosidase [Flavobacteriales bacterium]